MNIQFIGESKKIDLILNLITNDPSSFYYNSFGSKFYRKYYKLDDDTKFEFYLKLDRREDSLLYSDDYFFIIVDLSSENDIQYLNNRYKNSRVLVILGIQSEIGKEHERIKSFEDMKMYEKNSDYCCKYFEVSTERENVDAFNNLNASFNWAANQMLLKDMNFNYEIVYPFKFTINYKKCSLVSNCIGGKIKIYNSLNKEMIVQGCSFKLKGLFKDKYKIHDLILLFNKSDQSSFDYIKKVFNYYNRHLLLCTFLIGININHQIQSYSQSQAVSNEEINQFMNQLPNCKYFEINSNDDYQYVWFEYLNHVLNKKNYLKVELEEEKKLYNGNNEKSRNWTFNENMEMYKKILKEGYSEGCTIN